MRKRKKYEKKEEKSVDKGAGMWYYSQAVERDGKKS